LSKWITTGTWSVEASQDGQMIDKKARFHRDDYNNRVMVVSDHCDTHAIIDCSCNSTCVETQEQQDNAEFVAKVRNHFPDIAQALILAVEALEFMGEADILGMTHEQIAVYMREKAKMTLDRIHSLPSND